MAEFTKGEWKVGEKYGVDYQIYSYSPTEFPDDRKHIAMVGKSLANAHLIVAAPSMYEALKRIMALDDSGALEAVAYSGGDIPKKWMREEAPAIDARSKARKEIQDIIRPIIALAEGRTP